MDENAVWLAGVFLDGVWAGTEGDTVWSAAGSAPDGPAMPHPIAVNIALCI